MAKLLALLPIAVNRKTVTLLVSAHGPAAYFCTVVVCSGGKWTPLTANRIKLTRGWVGLGGVRPWASRQQIM